MSAADLLAGAVLDSAAALLNDQEKQIFTDTSQLPYLNIALRDLERWYQLNNVPVTDEHSAVIPVNTNKERMVYNGTTDPKLPDDMIEPRRLWERPRNSNPFVPMTKVQSLPLYMEGSQISQLIWWVWEAQQIKFMPANANNDVKIEYVRRLFSPATSASSPINVINAQGFLEYRTAALSAWHIGEDKPRSDELNGFASIVRDELVGISNKGRQAISVRRRPFRAAYKARGVI